MLNEFLFVLSACGFFRMFIYAIGEPHDMYNPKAILGGYSALLAEIRLEFLGILDRPTILQQGKKEDIIIAQEMHDAWCVDRVRPIAGVLNALGFCPICCSFWFMGIVVWWGLGSFMWYGISLLIVKAMFKWI